MREITAECGSVPQIGIRHENGRTVARISLKSIMDMVESHPGGSYTLAYRRRLDDQFYVSDDFTVADGYLEWTVGSHALAVTGDVTVQVSYATGSITAETPQMRFTVGKSIFNGENGQGENLSDLVEAAITAAGGISEALNEAREELDAKVTAAQTARGAAEAAQTAAERAQHTAENAKTSAAQSANAAYNFAADANTAKRDSVNAKNDAVQAKEDAVVAQRAAEDAEDSANTSALKSEGYAVGTQNGTPAGSGEPYYQDNAKYYKEQAAAAKTAAEAARDTAQQTVAGIEAAGTAQVQRVTAEGATQVGNVQTKGQQVLDSIPDDYSELSGEVTELKSALINISGTEIISSVSGYINTQETTIDASTVIPSATGYACAVVPCIAGDVFTINGTGGQQPRLWAFINDDAENNRLSVSAQNATGINLEIIAPIGATKLIINGKPLGPCYKGKIDLNGQIEKTNKEIDALKDEIITGNIPLDKSDIGNQYISAKTIGSAIAFASSSSSVTIKKIISVKQGYNYKVSVKDSDTPAGEGERDWVVTDASRIVRQAYKITNSAGSISELKFTAVTDGYLYLCVDKEYVSIEITGGIVFDFAKNFDKIHSIMEGSSALINLYDKTTYAPGVVSRNDGKVYSFSNVVHSDFIEIKPNTMYILSPEYTSSTYGIAFYDQNKTFVSGLEQQYSGQSGMTPFTFATPNEVKYLRFTIWHTFADIAYLYEWSDSAIKKVFTVVKTEGEKIIVAPESNIRLIYKYNASTWGYPQGGAIYGDKLFLIGNNLVKNAMFDFNTYKIVSVAYSGPEVDNHANNVNFGSAFYDDGDQFPLLYISSERANYCGIFRIIVDEGEYSLVEISRIILPNLSYVNLIVDAMSNMAYVRGSEDGTTKLKSYYLPSLFDQDITFENVPYSEQEHPYGYLSSVNLQSKRVESAENASAAGYKHDAFISANKFFTVGGYIGSANINVNSLEDGKLLSFANISKVVTSEPEVCEAYKNGIIIVSDGRMYYMKTV